MNELNIDEVAFLINLLTSPKFIKRTKELVSIQHRDCKNLCDCFTLVEDIYLNREHFQELEMLERILKKLKENEIYSQ